MSVAPVKGKKPGVCDHVVTMRQAASGFVRALSSNAAETGIGTALPSSMRCVMRPPAMAVSSSAASDPME